MVSKFKRYLLRCLGLLKPTQFCVIFNQFSRYIWRSRVSFFWDSQREKFVAQEGANLLYFARSIRAGFYRHGLDSRLDVLASEYFLDRIEFQDGDCVVDCGANVGEIGNWLLRGGKNLEILSIEPEGLEADCCDLNVYNGAKETIRMALWNEERELTFYSKNDSGDSSLFEPPEFQSTRKMQATTLASLMESRGITELKLLKLESEGAEPEILLGAGDFLERIHYIAADLGPERGPLQQTTVATAINLLLSRNFKVVDVFPGRLTFLFKNARF